MSTNVQHESTKLVVRCFSVSADGYGAGPRQSIDDPMGVHGMSLHEWVFPTRTFQRMLFNKDAGAVGPDDDFAARGFENIGAWILGRNMFGPVRGPWPDHTWNGWWGDEPPYHCEVFVLTNYPRPPIEMKGGTVFHFVSGIEAALQKARHAAAGKDWGVASQQSGNICAPAWSTNCISRSRRSCLDRAKAFSLTSIWSASVTSARSMRRPRTPPTSCCARTPSWRSSET